MSAVVRAAAFGYHYPESAMPALEDISFELEPGSFTVVAGLSGSGKSTLLRAACGLVPHFHGGDASGEFEVGGMSLRDHGPSDVAAVCGTVLQDPETQVVMNGVAAEIALPLENRGEAAGAVARGVEEAALSLGIAHLLDRRTDTLSGGELQRVALAAALAHRPALLVLDEPTSQLDPVAGDDLVWLLRRLNEEWGTAVLIAEHRLERCLPAADRVLAMRGGRIACDATPADFLAWASKEEPVLATPLARLFTEAGLGAPSPASVKEARAALAAAGYAEPGDGQAPARRPEERRFGLRRRRPEAALEMRGVWFEVEDGPVILRDLDLRLDPGERVALMGRNGAGKSTALRLAKGLADPTRGKVAACGPVALLLQNPGDYLVHEYIADEVGEAALERAGLAGRGTSHPRDLSGGERQRLALEVALGLADPAVVLLDEPTRGMDRAHKLGLGKRLEALAGRGAGVLVATHDAEWAAEWADRVVLLGSGAVVADGPAEEVLEGGWHFTTDTARAVGPVLVPEEGAAMVRAVLTTRKELVP
ncbi:MAG: ATP-binding cassette domain-containing protein [Thermoleophilaceae bacterium]|nr:ATP-binding cassette domain-containing protein [Thermoleophilaceae bacterium]